MAALLTQGNSESDKYRFNTAFLTGSDYYRYPKVRRVEHNMPKIWYYGVFSLFHRCRASARLPSQKQKSIHTLCIFGAEQFKTSRFLLKQGTKSPPYCRMARFLTQVRQKYAVLNHIGFNSPHLNRTYCKPNVWHRQNGFVSRFLRQFYCRYDWTQLALQHE